MKRRARALEDYTLMHSVVVALKPLALVHEASSITFIDFEWLMYFTE